jgi:hypothetical protein
MKTFTSISPVISGFLSIFWKQNYHTL